MLKKTFCFFLLVFILCDTVVLAVPPKCSPLSDGKIGWEIVNNDGSDNITYRIPSHPSASSDRSRIFLIVSNPSSSPSLSSDGSRFEIHVGDDIRVPRGGNVRIEVESGDNSQWKDVELEKVTSEEGSSANFQDSILTTEEKKIDDGIARLKLRGDSKESKKPIKERLEELAKEGKCIDIVKLIVENYHVLEADKETKQMLLYLSARLNYAGLIRMLHKLKLITDINAQDTDGRTALHVAVANRNEEAVDALLDLGANPLKTDISDKTAVHLSVVSDSHRSLNITKKLLFSIKKIGRVGDRLTELQDSDGNLPLHIAASNGKLLQTRLLLKNGLDPEVKNKEEKTPLELADKNPRLQKLLSKPFVDSEASDTDSEDESDYEYEDLVQHHGIRNDLLIGHLPNGSEIRFQEERVVPDGNCGFTVLGTSREELTRVLMEHASEEEVKTAIMPEIFEATLNGDFRYEGSDEALGAWNVDYFLIKEVFEAYLRELQNESRSPRLWIGYHTMLEYARRSQINLYIWDRDERTNGLRLLNSYEDNHPRNTIHVLYTAGHTHFNLLTIVPSSVLGRIYSTPTKSKPARLTTIAPGVLLLTPERLKETIVHYRGIHFFGKKVSSTGKFENGFSRLERRKMVLLDKMQQQGTLRPLSVFSTAAHQMVKLRSVVPDLEIEGKSDREVQEGIKEREEKLQGASAEIKALMARLQEVRTEHPIMVAEAAAKRQRVGERNRFDVGYESIYLELVQRYVNTYEGFLNFLENADGVTGRDPRTKSMLYIWNLFYKERFDQMPFVSTSEKPEHPLKYAFATNKEEERGSLTLTPQYQADGHPRFPYLGIVYISLHDKEELKDEKESTRVTELAVKKLINLNTNRRGGQLERIFIGNIDGKHICAAIIMRVPNFFGEYKEFYSNKYGMSKRQFEEFKSKIARFPLGSVDGEVIEFLTDFYEKKLIKIAADFAREKGKVLRYLDENGAIASNPPSSGEIRRAREAPTA